jgi:ribonuclease HI
MQTLPLFQPPATDTPMVDGVLRFDGGCSPNPGRMTGGYILAANGRRIEQRLELGHGTNNVSEYLALIRGMQKALELGVERLQVYGDSQLVLNGVRSMRPWKKGKPHLEKLKAEAQSLVRRFPGGVTLTWVPRHQNAEADAIGRRHWSAPSDWRAGVTLAGARS